MAENKQSYDGKERRRAERYGASHPAILKIEGLAAFDCDIQDYCEAGFYLSAAKNSALQNILSAVQVGTKLVVEYSIAANTYKVSGETARLSSDGLGVYAPKMPEDAFLALFGNKAKTGNTGTQQISGSPQLIAQCREQLFVFAKKFVTDFYEQAGAMLQTAIDEASFSERADYQHALNALKADPSRAQSGFEVALREEVEEFENGSVQKKESKLSDGELSLIDKRGFEEWLAVSSIAYRLEGMMSQEMAYFELRYASLSGRLVDRKTSPYAPDVICRLFDEQLRKMELAETGEEVVHGAMSKVLAEEMAALYEKLNEIVAPVDPITKTGGSASSSAGEASDGDVGDEADQVPEEQVSADESDANADANTNANTNASTNGDANGNANTNTNTNEGGGGGDAHGDFNGSGNANGFNQDMGVGAPNMNPGGDTGSGYNESQQGHRPVPKAQREYSFENLFRAIQRSGGGGGAGGGSNEGIAASGGAPLSSPAASSYFNPMQAAPARYAGSGGGGSAGGYGGASAGGGSGIGGQSAAAPSGQAIARAFAGMRGASTSGRATMEQASARAANIPQPEQGEVVNLLDQIEPKARTRGDGGSSLPLSKRLSRKIEATALAGINVGQREQLHTVADIMDKAVSEYDATSQIEALVVALEKSLLKLVMVDPDFLEDEFHPARRFMNTLDQFAIAADDEGNFYDPKLYEFLDSLINKIVEEPTVNKDIFETSLEQISAMLMELQQLRLKRVSLLQESSEARERVRTARSITAETLDELYTGKSVAASAMDLLDIGWRHHLNLIELRETTSSELWKEAVDTFVAVNQLLSQEESFEYLNSDGALDESALEDLLHKVEQGLACTSTDTDGVESLVASVRTEIISGAGESPEMREYVANSAQNSNMQPSEAGIARIGEWWSVPVSGKKVITQLIWKNSSQEKYAATNRSASRRWELNASQFEKDIAAGKISRIGEGQFLLFDRSEGALFDDLYKRLASQIVKEEHVGIVNRKGFIKKLDEACVEEGNAHVLCMIEFDQFRVIRHNCGMEVCDKLSNELVNQIHETLDRSDVISAFAEDSFMILMKNCDQKRAEEKANKILELYKDYKYEVGGDTYRLGLNIGLAETISGTDSADAALRHVDSACIAAKGAGRNQLQFYDAANKQMKVQDSVMELAGSIDRIIANGGLYLRAQMVMPVGDGEGMSPYHEILLGITDEQGLRVVPEKFIQAIERLRRTDELDTWVIKKTFDWIKANPEKFKDLGGFSINLSGASLVSQDVLDYLLAEIPKLGVAADRLVFEITETAAIENYDSAKDFLWEVRRLGCKFSLDDFGTGYASYSHLRKLRPDILKIDGSFIWNLASDNSDFVLVKSMNDIGKALGFKTVAEYVESPAILSKLAEIGVDYAQGYAIHRPEALEEMATKSNEEVE